MLNKEFNKLGGTEIRVKHQIDFYIMLCEWIKRTQKQKNIKNLSINEWNHKFKKWTKKEDIYNYDNDKKIKMRFNFIIGSLKKIGIYYQKEKFKIPKKFNSNIIFNNLMSYQNNNIYPFKEMIKFVLNNPQKNNAKKIILSFLVFDGKETFADLYKKNIIKELTERMSSKIPEFRKTPKAKKYIDIILEKKKHNHKIKIDDMVRYNEKSENYIRPIIFKKNERFNLAKMIDRLNQIDLKTFLYKLHWNKISQILENEYLDLFSRWLYDFGLINVAGKKATIFYNHKIKKQNNHYYIKKEIVNKYPWKFEEVVSYISKIAKNDFTFKDRNKDLKHIANSIIAEYFVNLYYSYKLEIKPQKFSEFVNTKVSYHLRPIFTAPGNKPDMSYSNKSVLINIETTINKTKTQIENNEIFPCTRHYKIIAKESNASFRCLIFISPLNPDDIKRQFNLVFKSENPNSDLFIYKFDNLKIPFHTK